MLTLVAIPAATAAAADGGARPQAGDRGGEPGFLDVRLGEDPARRSARLRVGQARLRHAIGSQAIVRADALTGTPRVITGRNAFVTAPSRARARNIALTYLRRHPAVFGLDANDIDGLRVVREQRFSLGLRRVQFAQTAHGISSLDTGIRAAVDGKGHLISVTGAPRPDLAGAGPTKPNLDAAGALRRAIADVGSDRSVRLLGASEGADRETRFAGGHSAHLTYFVEATRVRLAWRTLLFDDSQHVYDSVIDAHDGTTLRRVNRVRHATGMAWDYYPLAPAGGTAASHDFTALGWLTAADRLQGQNALVYSDVDDDLFTSIPGGVPTPGPDPEDQIPPSSGNWNYTQDPVGHADGDERSCPIVGDVFGTCSWDSFTANGWTTNREQAGTQLFYFVNRFHDHLKNAQGIGFDSAAGNFEGNDFLHAQSNDGANEAGGFPYLDHINNANIVVLPDGVSPRMQMYLWSNPGPVQEPQTGVNTGVNDVNGADDGAIVFHEYTHGLVDRLLCCDANGFGVADGPQAGAMNEAWADWYAFDYLVANGFMSDSAAAGEVAFSPYENAPIRSQPADCPPGGGGTACPGPVPDGGGAGSGGYTYGDFGRIFPLDEQPDGVPDGEVHADGEIWASTLWDLRTAMIAAYPADGVTRTRALVTMGMLVSPASPTFLEMRNAIIAGNFALGLDQSSCQVIWRTFAARGMGSNASTEGNGDTEPVEGFTDPGAPACVAPASGDGSVGSGDTAAAPLVLPPARPNLAGARSRIRATSAGRFRYSLRAGTGLGGKAVFRTRRKAVISRKAQMTMARKSFTVAATGRVTLRIKLSRKRLRILKRNRRLYLRVSVTVRNAAGSAIRRKNLTLLAPRR